MPINVHSVANHLEQEGWKLISTEYKNLNTELEMECPKGHQQTQTYGHWRKYMICEKCMGGRIKKNLIPEKKENTTRILALDAATNITGFAVFDDKELVHYGVFKAPNGEAAERINQVKKWLMQIIDKWSIDFCGIENIQLQTYGGATNVELYRVLANLQGVLVDTLYEKAIDYELAYSTEWRKYCGINEGKGREYKKKMAQEKVKLWYDINCTQDEADAICLGKYFCSRIRSWGEG